MTHDGASFSSTVFEMPLDGLEVANKYRSEQALKLARSVIQTAGGPFINENWFWSPLYALSPQDTPCLKARKKVQKIINGLRYRHDPILVDSVNEVRQDLHIGRLGSFSKDEFHPYRFRLNDKDRFVRWDDSRMVVEGSLEVALNELEAPGISRHPAKNFGFTSDTESVEVARIRTLYADRGVYQLDELVGNTYVGMDRIIGASGKLGNIAVRLVQNYYLAEAEQKKIQNRLREVS